MAENKNRWNWEVSGFEPRKTSSSSSSTSPFDRPEDQRPAVAPLVRRYSISATSVSPHSPEISRQALATKVQRLKDKLKFRTVVHWHQSLLGDPILLGLSRYQGRSRVANLSWGHSLSFSTLLFSLAKEDYLGLRQEASDLQEYSNAKLDRVTRYLGVLAEKTHKLDQVAIETEARISPLINEKKRLFNDLLTSKGNIKVFCRTRPLFEDEGHSVVEFPDDCTIRVNTRDDSISNPKKDFEFDRVYGPHVGQAELFSDVQPLVQSGLDGFNVSIFAYGQTHSGKTHTMVPSLSLPPWEGSSHDRGLYARCFEELFDLSNSDSTSTSQFKFSVTVFELYNEQIRDLLSESGSSLSMVRLGTAESFIELVQEKVDNPLEFSKVLKSAFQSRGNDVLKFNVSHLIIMIHIYYNNLITGENTYSKLSLVDLAGSEGLITEDDSGERVTDLLHVMKSLSALGDVLSSLTSRKDIVPYENSMLTKVFADSLGTKFFFLCA
ncbi:hypothetical protein Pint_27684 [Pistacia integerrima]|uniref:Uncharacterized protein n=1 Tax=Pistacia integerrima TaxID=434235 RepID=A0ACC0YV88_9ROSI|nr:hypothetical protein Pint_27684 [Pistacia integerrima]